MTEIKPVYQAVLEEGLKACEELFERDYFGNHNVKIEDFHPTRERFAKAAAAYEALQKANAAQAKRIAELEGKKIEHHELTDKELSDKEYVKAYIESMNDSFDESIKYQTTLNAEIESLRKQVKDYEFRFGILKQIEGIKKVIGS